MPLLRYVSTTFALVVAIVLGALSLLSDPAVSRQSLIANSRIPDPPALPCKKQAWWNADRICLTWTAPRATTDADHARNIESAAPAAERNRKIGSVGRMP